MLVATRDPLHHSGASDPSVHRDERIHLAPPKTGRVLSLLQLTGSFLAIPVALGSAYSVYNVNFSADTRCELLRGSIIAMIDKKIDAATRRMLVRRDVEAFEKSCGAFDPDAKAAFVMLLQEGSRTVPVRSAAAPKAEVAKPEPAKADAAKATPAKVEAPKAEPRTVTAAKAAPVKVDAETSETANNDARWLEAVRGALVAQETARSAAAATSARAPLESHALRPSVAPAAPPPAVTTPNIAPALPPAVAVAPSVAAASGDDRPVPPGAIPEPAPLDIAKAVNGPNWVVQIPFVGQLLDR